jgi:hypothetical protein
MKIVKMRNNQLKLMKWLLATFIFVPTLSANAQVCPSPSPVDRQFVDALVAKQSTIGDFHALATAGPPRADNLQLDVFGRLNGGLSKVITKANGTTAYTQYYDGRFFWHEQGQLVIKVPATQNPNQLIGQAASPQPNTGCAGTKRLRTTPAR